MSAPFVRRLLWSCPLLLVIGLGSCGKPQQYRKETFPVTGRVVVDGQPPSSPIQIECHNVAGMDQQHPTVSQTMTGEDGKFAISTYESGDGVPAGEYALTFYWGQLNLISANYGGPDKLKKRYRDPKKSEIKFTVEPGQPTDLGTLELTTK